MLQHAHHRVPVTASAFLEENVILTGEGDLLCAYDVERKALLATLRVFDGQAIHGLVASPHDANHMLAFGGRLIRIITIVAADDHSIRLGLGGLFDAGDWILDAAYSPPCMDSGASWVAFVTAHNSLLVVSAADLMADDETRQATGLLPIVQVSDCILYAAHVAWLSDSHCLIASGTAFGDVIIWSCILSVSDHILSARHQTHYTFSAHEGSVFGVHLSDLLVPGQLGECRHALLTCSDDRTIGLWDISDLTAQSLRTQHHRDTGFGVKAENANITPPCLGRTMGHVSRIWHVRFVADASPAATVTSPGGPGDPPRNHSVRFMSFGEDATSLLWTVNRTNAEDVKDMPFSIQQVSQQSAHSGKHIWAVTQSSHGHTATGGSDGALAIRSSAQTGAAPREVTIGSSSAKDNIKAYGFVNHDSLICTTTGGRIVRLDSGEDVRGQATELSTPLAGLKGYSIVHGVPGVAFIGGVDGSVYAYSHASNALATLIRADAKISGLFASKVGDSKEGKAIAVLITSMGMRVARLVFFEDTMHSKPAQAMDPRQAQLETEDGVATSFTHLNADYQDYAIVGFRDGSLSVYLLSSPSADPVKRCSHHLKAHGKEAVTALYPLHHGDGSLHLHSTGRDGTHAVFRFCDLGRLELVHQLTLPFGPNIEGLSLSPDNDLRLWGFRHKQFVVYDMTNSRDIMAVDCGGAHRSWTYTAHPDGGTFVWTKASRVCSYTQTQLPYRLLNHGSHGREIKTAAVTSVLGLQVIATGAEDTNIKLYVASSSDASAGLTCVQTLRKHTTGIQHIQLFSDGHLFSSGGFEELFVWRIRPGVPGVGLGVVCESKHPRSGTSDLRVMGFSAAGVQRNGTGQDSESGDEAWLIDMLYSDSTVKRWRYVDCVWELLAQGDYLTACLTNIQPLPASGNTFVTSATDGHLALWTPEASMSLSWSARHQVHQNAILSMAAVDLGDKSSMMITGGDDNAIALTRLGPSPDHTASTLILPRAHAAAVTGLVACPCPNRPSAWFVLSTSIDQRLKLWMVDVDVTSPGVEGVDVKLLRNLHTSVADASSLNFCSLGDRALGVVICGVGMDIWRLRLDESDG